MTLHSFCPRQLPTMELGQNLSLGNPAQRTGLDITSEFVLRPDRVWLPITGQYLTLPNWTSTDRPLEVLPSFLHSPRSPAFYGYKMVIEPLRFLIGTSSSEHASRGRLPERTGAT